MNSRINDNNYAHPINSFFLIFLFAGLITPWNDLYKAIFYIFVVPLVFWTLYKKPDLMTDKDGVIRLSVILVVYIACSSFLISDISVSRHLRQFRWAIETLVLVFALQIVTLQWLNRPAFYGRLFLIAVLTASLITLLMYFTSKGYPERLEGYGFLDHSIAGAAVLIILWAMGTTLINAADRLKSLDYSLILISLLIMSTVCVFTMSRGPIISLLMYLLFIGTVLFFTLNRKQKIISLSAIGIAYLLLLWLAVQLNGHLPIIDNMIERGASYRLDIWLATINHPPASILFGEGYGTLFADTPAGLSVMQQTGVQIWHPHNLLLSVYYFSGLVGAFLFLLLFVLLVRRIFHAYTDSKEKSLMLGLIALVIMLNMTRGHPIIVSPDPMWVSFWIPLIFLSAYARHRLPLSDARVIRTDAHS